ncbi:MAG: signal peptidase I [Candidatus Pacebacteria bacterium]|nr:signal peptidase I [Candidatus Paceibacterota bacterium]MDR3583344.1 signal peptidase I [Candidatus Paceibacterota bacterium]
MLGKIFKIIVNTILGLLIVLGLFVIFSFMPFPGNYKIFVVESGSMEPTIKTGSLIFVKPEADYFVGNIITRTTSDPKVTITHRIVSKKEVNKQEIFDTKGDANNAPDGANFPKSNIIGKELVHLPWIGYPVGYAKTTPGLILLIIVPAVIIIYDELNKIKEEISVMMERKKKGKEKKEEKPEE